MPFLHPTAVVDPQAVVAESAHIGPFCVVGPHVRLGENVTLHSHAVVDGRTEIGEGSELYPFSSIGHPPQDLKYSGEASRLVIGRNCRIREHVTMNPGTEGGGMLTQVGDNCLFMASSHVAHDCKVGNNVIMANNATLAGHVEVGDFAIIGGLAAVQQFVRVGPHAMIGGMSGVVNDVIPYGLVMGAHAALSGLNLVGLRRRGFAQDEIKAMREAYRLLFSDQGTLAERLDQVEATLGTSDSVRGILDFARQSSDRGLLKPRPEHAG
ncbi:MAG: acyl-ACP--UDP-N-acetylglucosamine O-acyltransferase [Alphaproteobacteria bacterium]|nr:acyl-ACP--UDP-N-acetylglucosamine O-acyltransferase [Alphaproteobacteria bacterium]MCB9930074.1 acyl-ACP--UDP-N-acetylglucosamine O-acyltransferase [Alphaproteobacteria bacterium]